MYPLSKTLGIRHAAIAVSDLTRSIDFYTKTLGFSKYRTGDSDWAMVQIADTTLSLIQITGKQGDDFKKLGSHVAHLGICVTDVLQVDEWHSKLKSRGDVQVGACVLHRDKSYGFYLKDPDGNAIEVIFIPLREPKLEHQNEAWIILAHGSGDPSWRKPFDELVQRTRGHFPHKKVELAFMEFASPDLDAVAASFAKEKIKHVCVFPAFFSSGGHVLRDLPALLKQVKDRFPAIDFRMTLPLGEHVLTQEALIGAMADLSGI